MVVEAHASRPLLIVSACHCQFVMRRPAFVPQAQRSAGAKPVAGRVLRETTRERSREEDGIPSPRKVRAGRARAGSNGLPLALAMVDGAWRSHGGLIGEYFAGACGAARTLRAVRLAPLRLRGTLLAPPVCAAACPLRAIADTTGQRRGTEGGRSARRPPVLAARPAATDVGRGRDRVWAFGC